MNKEIRIVKIHKSDAYYPDRKQLIGLKGRLVYCPEITLAGFVACTFIPNNKKAIKGIFTGKSIEFYAVMLEAV